MSPTARIYTNLAWMNANHNFINDACEFAILSGHRIQQRVYVQGHYEDIHGHRTWHYGKYHPTEKEPQSKADFLLRLSRLLKEKRRQLIADQTWQNADLKTAITKINIPFWGGRGIFNRCNDGKYSPAIMVLICETLGAPYQILQGTTTSRRGAIEVDWVPPIKKEQA